MWCSDSNSEPVKLTAIPDCRSLTEILDSESKWYQVWWWELRTKRKKEAIYLVTISLQRRNFSSEFHDAPITPAKIFQKEIFFNRAKSWNDCEMFIVFCYLLQYHGKKRKHNALVVITQKQKKRTQMCIECECWTTMILRNKQEAAPEFIGSCLGPRTDFYC